MEFLRSKQLLLVLDNCEHLLEAAAALAGVLARSCERLVILATSREALGIEGEQLVPVPPLGVPGADADLAAITQAEAVRLFAERAAAVKPGFQVTAENAAAVAAVVRRLDGIALAIELAAARVPAMTPAELARRLERSFAVLAAGPRGAAARHQTLRATIDWSFQLLAEARAGPAGPAGGVRRRLPPWRPPRRSAAGRASIRTRCSSCWRPGGAVAGGGRGTRARRPATGCWRRSASTARNASRRPGRPSGGGPATPATTRTSSGRVRDHAHDPDGPRCSGRSG